MLRNVAPRLTPRIIVRNARFASQNKIASEKVNSPQPTIELSPDDPRPLWVYRMSVGLRYLLIPTALIYGVFFADFGEDDHVFVPPRRWLDRQKAAFFPSPPVDQSMEVPAEPPASTSTDKAV